MGFLGGIWRKCGSSCMPGFNFATRHSLGTVSGGGISLEYVKQKGTLEQKKRCMRKILKEMELRISEGFLSGPVDPTKIHLIGDSPILPYGEAYIGGYPSYFSSVKNLAIYLHDNDQMGTRDTMKFEDFKKYSSLGCNTRHLALLAGHPHLQTTCEEREYIPEALQQLDLLPTALNVCFPDNHFPPLPPDPSCHQVPLALAIKYPPELQMTWKDAYKKVCITREINIAASIEHAGRKFKKAYKYRNPLKPRLYTNNDAIDELFYYSNMSKHECDPGDNKILDILHDKFPFNTIEMFKFHWTYDRHAMGEVDLERIMHTMSRRR